MTKGAFMRTNEPNPKIRYPLQAIFVVFAAWLGFLFMVVAGFPIALCPPLACFYAFPLVGYTGVLSAAHAYARRHAIVVAPPKPAAQEARAIFVRRTLETTSS
jgi:hypothetical protein